ncbi:S-adenosylmethionine:tRNA ribosyltransferase-isomerase [Niabella drilacis]|uniref:S-adenosylmethionine:tRNA ribosyltransferase-isomerase n=1 Tax=Niabella drilacis (strain DSM 25811 / CCM 8410 / CCUG 62505 / LMG 26954 / E90) TaxID=1285928 RepID=A0A1G6RYT8_NIADE|nr:S-adenosylmethionine:tRNA ribosyltransferase-isomerase [Niabella drilacis]SDD09832.1 S-adenosylmethionine:tRNA ribosyltransferase-isomerase [Niabella drilacis]
MHPKDLNIADFTYELPEAKIAFFPLTQRDASRLLVYQAGTITTGTYRHIDQYIPEHSLAVFNNTKVVEARILFKKPTGGQIEVFCLEPHESYADITTAMAQQGKVLWCCLIGGASKWKSGQVLTRSIAGPKGETVLEARFIEKRSDSFLIELSWTPAFLSFAEILHATGQIPLPPYIKRIADKADEERYQTVYAAHDGSVAAPTAGLHFTEDVLKKLHAKNIQTDFVTLHVGAGTFKPVKAAIMNDHEMHAEFIVVTPGLIRKIAGHQGHPLIAVGTTSLRTLESLYWLGAKLLQDPDCFSSELPHVDQWDPYEESLQQYTVTDALEALAAHLSEKHSGTLVAKTQIIIAPGYPFKIADALVTNFHQPSSTLLLLVAAFIGDDWRKVYDYALANDFRFLSYGDGSLLWRG